MGKKGKNRQVMLFDSFIDDEMKLSRQSEKIISKKSKHQFDSLDFVIKDLSRYDEVITTTSSKRWLSRGLINPGNLCFMNATLQALHSCSPFIQLLQKSINYDISKVDHPTTVAFVEFLLEFDMFDDFYSMNNKTCLEIGRPFSPIMFGPILSNFMPNIPSTFQGIPSQEDAQEFLNFVINQIHDELISFEDHLLALEFSKIFEGQLRSVVEAEGENASITIQPFLSLHLDISLETIHCLDDALYLFTAPEEVEGYRSSKMGEMVKATKSVKIQSLPKILIIHLMRFSYGYYGSKKLHKRTFFPITLCLGKELFASPSTKDWQYELVATITHHGHDLSMGHYTADAKCPNDQWLRYDDASVTSISTNMVLDDQPYLLLYRQL